MSDDSKLQYAIETALQALRIADDVFADNKNEETGWRSDEYCEAYQVLSAFCDARWGKPRS